ncbi:MAG TPA: M48 family metallopeptidase [Gemmatimonadales bacterium]|nr:M48 family metallopeptidase [Gemmatimonadales bacterium]
MLLATRLCTHFALAATCVAGADAALPRRAVAQSGAIGSLPGSLVPEAARIRPGVPFDVDAATDAWLATIPPEKRARSDAYYEGGYWIGFWMFLLGAAIALITLQLGWSRRLRDWAERRSGRPWVAAFLYYAGFVLLVSVLSFPFGVYTGFVREHAYGLATQSFGGWMRDQLVGLGVSIVLGGIAVATLYAVLRRLPRTWPVWGAAVSIAFLVAAALIGPVFIAPLFNKYTPLEDPRIRDPILRLARANGVAAQDVWVMDASRQTTRVSANVSGLLGTERITLNDNLLRRASPPEIEAVMGHELGHYVLHHVYVHILFLALLVLAGFAFVRWGFERAATRWGPRWGIRGIGDPAGMPLLWLLFSVYGFVTNPLVATFTRAQEAAADLFALNAARQPDAEALVMLKLADYRKLDPGPLEELIFFDHPSGRSRIRMAMQWKAEAAR